MKFDRTLLLSAGLVGLAFLSTEANATQYVATFTGTVTQSQNGLGYFGGGNLDGDSFTLKVYFDPTVGHVLDYSGSTPPAYYIYGGSAFGYGGPVTSTSLTIAGQTITTDASFESELDEVGPVTPFDSHFAAYGDTVSNNGTSTFETNLSDEVYSPDLPSIPYDFGNGFTASNTFPTGNSGSFQYTSLVIATDTLTGETSGAFITDSVVVSPVTIPGGAPEPSNWLLLLAGFFGLGTAVRVRRSSIKTA